MIVAFSTKPDRHLPSPSHGRTRFDKLADTQTTDAGLQVGDLPVGWGLRLFSTVVKKIQ